jgi:uroporphyrin-III C-methyltransferase
MKKEDKVLPLMVALRVEGKRALVVGGGSVALQRIRALLGAGARPFVVARQPSTEVSEIATREDLSLACRDFEESDLEGVAIALVAIDDSLVSREIAERARARKIPVNVADVPPLCDFYFCALHRQGPLQLAVSTNGQAPGLAGRVRDELARELPVELDSALESFSRLRQAFREAHPLDLAGRMKTLRGLARRLSWRQLAQLPAKSSVARPPVYLVGAGPGDPELLTVKAQRLLQTADLVIADRLISREMLALVRGELRVADKSPGRADASQKEIDDWMLSAAAEGRCVVRLKIGDPYLFGRGGEEVELLRSHGLEVEVVPGITSAFAAPLVAGIPLTQRGVADRLCVFTAKGRGNTTPLPPSFHASTTFIALMGMGALPELVPALLRRGFPRSLPAACVVAATCSEERVVRAPLHDLPRVVAEQGLGPPGVLVFGEVAALGSRQSLQEVVALAGATP